MSLNHKLINGRFCLFDLILYVPVNNFSVVGMGLPGMNQYLAEDTVSCSGT